MSLVESRSGFAVGGPRQIENGARTIVVHDTMQSGYHYDITAPEGGAFHEGFHPQLTPAQMLEMGVFGGRYLTDCRSELPAHWFANAKLSPEGADPALNYFGVHASKSLSYWREKGWIHPNDPRGWFQWYCRYYLGRRTLDDGRQVGRWRAMRRHVAQVVKNCRTGDLDCRRRQRQALLHWAYDSRKI